MARTICGAARPIKPTGPAPATAAPPRSATVVSPRMRVRVTGNPSVAATDSPRLRRLSPRPWKRHKTAPIRKGQNTARTTPISRSPTDPVDHARRASRDRLLFKTSALTSPINRAASATPARMSARGFMATGPNDEIRKTNPAVMAQPMIAGSTKLPGSVPTPAYTAITTARAAPAFMPKIWGSASGFRVCPWINAPAPPSATPVSKARTVRGTRSPPISTTRSLNAMFAA